MKPKEIRDENFKENMENLLLELEPIIRESLDFDEIKIVSCVGNYRIVFYEFGKNEPSFKFRHIDTFWGTFKHEDLELEPIAESTLTKIMNILKSHLNNVRKGTRNVNLIFDKRSFEEYKAYIDFILNKENYGAGSVQDKGMIMSRYYEEKEPIIKYYGS